MSKISVQIDKKEDGDYASIQAKFTVGKIAKADTPNQNYITMPTGTANAMYMLREVLKQADKNEDGWESKFDLTLLEYCKQWMLFQIGMNQHPLQYDPDGNITGLNGEYEIENKTDERKLFEEEDEEKALFIVTVTDGKYPESFAVAADDVEEADKIAINRCAENRDLDDPKLKINRELSFQVTCAGDKDDIVHYVNLKPRR